MSAYVNIVGAYKHLGSWVQVNGNLNKELSCRVAIGHATMSKYRSAIFSNRALPLVRKVHLFQSLVLSAVMFNAPAWYLQRKKDVERFHSGIMALYRRLANNHFGLQARTWRDETVQARLSLPSPFTLLHLHRLRYLQHIVRRGDGAVWASLQQHAYWWEMVDLSLTWLRQNVLRPLPDIPVSDHWSHWEPFLAPAGGAWQSLLRRAVRHDALQTRKSSAWSDFHLLVCHYMVEQGFQTLPFYAVECDQFACARCRQSFRTCSAWSVHAFRKHGRTTISRQVAQGDSCAICLKKFHDHNGLVNHIKNNPDCFWQLRTTNGLVDPQPSLNSRTEIRSRTELRTPVYRLSGPKPPLVDVADPMPSTAQQELFDAWDQVRCNVGNNFQDHEQVRELLRLATLDTVLPIHEILYVAWSWLRLLRGQGTVVIDQGFDQVFTRFIRGLDAPWLLQDQSLRRPKVTDPEEILSLWLNGPPTTLPVPRPLKLKQIIVAHLFSGRRRPGDLQAQLEQLCFPGGEVVVLSVDIIFSEQWGNLLRPDTLELFLRACREGLIIAIVAGPCETWSIARLRAYMGDGGPRPVRNIDHLAGFNLLSIREAQQVCVGNELFGVAMALATAMWCAAGLMILEHPAEPAKQPGAASIWRTTLVRFLLSRPGCVRHRVYQGHFGARSSKPTDLLVVSPPPNLAAIFNDLRLCQSVPAGGTIGRDELGRYRTATLKEYPPRFCHALAHVILAHVQNRGMSNVCEHCPEDVYSKFQHLLGSLDHDVQTMGPDFNPATLN